MENTELVNSSITRLPKTYKGNFKTYIENLFDSFFSAAKAAKFPSDLNSELCLKKLDNLINGIKSAIEEYYNGYPFKAYENLNTTIKNCFLTEIWTKEDYVSPRNFY